MRYFGGPSPLNHGESVGGIFQCFVSLVNFFLGLQLESEDLVKIFSAKRIVNQWSFFDGSFSCLRVLAKKVTYPTLTRVKGFVCKISRVARI